MCKGCQQMKKITYVLALTLFATISAHAGTIGMSGQWDFEGHGGLDDGSEVTDLVTGFFDFDAGTVTMESMFFGSPVLYDGTLSDSDGDGVYVVNTTTMWNANSETWDGLWDITDNGDGTASVVNGPTFFPLEPPYPYIIEGSLTSTVPVPAAVWLFGSGLIGLVGFARRKKV